MYLTDAYKMGHYKMYPEGLTKLTSCLVPRNTKYAIKPINPEDKDKVVVFGIGAVNYQFITRDTYGFAIKANNAVINGKEISLYKDPATDRSKKSPLGAVKVVQTESGIRFFDDRSKEEAEEYKDCPDLLECVYEHIRPNFNEIRKRVKES